MLARAGKPWATFDCLDCGEEFQVRWAEGDPDPDCMACWRREREARDKIAEMVDEGKAPAVSKGIHGADVTYNMMEREYGITDLNDNLREGDIAYKTEAPRTQAEQNALIKAELEYMTAKATAPQNSGIQSTWNGTASASAGANAAGISPVMAQGKAATEAARAQGAPDPLTVMEKVRQASPRPRFNVLARADRQGNIVSSVRRK